MVKQGNYLVILIYAPGTSKISTYLPSCELIMRLLNKYSREMLGDDAPSLAMDHLWVRPCAHVLPFSFTLHFSFIRFIVRSAPFFYDLVRLSGSSALITFMSSICVYSLYMATISIPPLFLISLLAIICVDVTPTASLCMLCIKKKSPQF